MNDFVFAVIAYLIVIGSLTLIHEYGHYQTAKWFGIPATKFSLGFGKPLWSRTDKHGTQWQLAPFLIGGYVKLPEDANGKSAIDRLPYWKKTSVVFAGPLANFIVTLIGLTILYSNVGINVSKPYVESVIAGGPADKAGFKAGDLILEIEGNKIRNTSDLLLRLSAYPNKTIDIEIARGSDQRTLQPTLGEKVIVDDNGNHLRTGTLGIVIPNAQFEDKGVVESLERSNQTMGALFDVQLRLIGSLLRGERSLFELSGPIRIAKTAGKQLQIGFIATVMITSFVSFGMGIINLLPIPGLDGGHILRYTIEAIMQKEIPEKALRPVYLGGAALLGSFIAIMIVTDLLALRAT